MKKSLIMLVMFGFTLLASCSKEKNDEVNIESKLLGKWQLKTAVADNNQIDPEVFLPGDYLQFERDGKLTLHVDDATAYATWYLSDGGKTLFILSNDDILEPPKDGYEIKTLTNNTLVLYARETGGSVTINLQK